ncbi:ethylene-responsive element-binding protein [Musa troglodytarum]|uniref:Ethylene-responsive element-binding protein n=1 Tax=Musa troglodytarum TaxID=320322 RepID=A0A9E7L3C9_9LILI|nr:ethylene-responsive element-binding protein [Musa troglodytarum]
MPARSYIFMGWNMHLAHMTIQQVESLRLSLINVQDSGSLCNCLLPEALKITAVQHDPVSQTKDGERRRLRSAFSCLSSISMRHKRFSAASLLSPPFRGAFHIGS